MNERNNKLELLGSAPIPKALMALGIPIMIGMLINALYNLVDAYFVAGLGKSQMGAISVVFPLGQVVVGLGLMFGNGAASYLSRLLGRGDKDTADKVASTALYSSILIGAIIILLSTIFLKPILGMLGTTETIMPYAMTYARIYVLSCIFNVFNVTMNNIVSSEGAAKTTMCALLLGAVLNIGLDPLFIYILDMGVEGAAIATAISQMVSTLVYLTYVLRKKSVFTFSIKEFSPTGQMMTEILKIGVPTLVFQLLTSLSIALINRASSNYGDSVIAGMGAVTRITSMGTLVVFGFLKGFQPIAGFSYGAKKFDRLREAIKTSIIWSTSFCLVVGLVMAVFSTQIISQFTKGDTQMILVGQKSLFANGITYDMLRKQREEPLEEVPDAPDDAPVPDDAVVSTDNIQHLTELIGQMKPMYRDPLRLLAMGYTNREIAESLGLTDEVVRMRLFRGRKLLWKELDSHE